MTYKVIKFILMDSLHLNRMRTVRFDENIAAVKDNVDEDPNLPMFRRDQEVVCPSTLWKTQRKYLGLVCC